MVWVIVSALIILFWLARFVRSKRNRADFTQDQDHTDDLVRLCGGDADQAERLITFEVCQNPAISRHKAIQTAIGRYRRDHR